MNFNLSGDFKSNCEILEQIFKTRIFVNSFMITILKIRIEEIAEYQCFEKNNLSVTKKFQNTSEITRKFLSKSE